MIVGILGGGQLARMLALAGVPLGIETVVVDPSPSPCAALVARHVAAPYDDAEALDRLSGLCDVVTCDFENVPAAALERVARTTRVYPGARSLAVLQDRLTEKTCFSELGIPTPRFHPATSPGELRDAIESIGMPCVVKSRRFGYDGKGQAVIDRHEDVDRADELLAASSVIVESFIPFEHEVALVAARSTSGEHVYYPLVESHHVDGILRWVVPIDAPELQQQAEQYAGRLLDELGHVGALGFEFFRTSDGLLANEAAPRVHNTGHWTIEGAATSQFENHLRAIAGLPLGNTATTGFAGNVNFIGSVPDPADVLAVEGAHHHDYGKEPRPGRKVGHATVVTKDVESRDAGLIRLRELAEAALR